MMLYELVSLPSAHYTIWTVAVREGLTYSFCRHSGNIKSKDSNVTHKMEIGRASCRERVCMLV